MKLSILFLLVAIVATCTSLFGPVAAERASSVSEQRYPTRSRTHVRDLGETISFGSDVSGGSAPLEWVSETTNWTDYNSSQLDCNLYRTLSAASGRLQMKEVVDPLSNTVTFEMIYQGRAWLGVALASNGKMSGNVVVVGRPNALVGIDNPAKFRTIDQTLAGLQLLPEEYQTLSNVILEQNETHTVMRFTQLLNETEEPTIVTAPGLNTAIYAVGGGNDIDIHQYFGVFKITLTYCLKPGQDPTSINNSEVQGSNTSSTTQSIWIAHGVLMALAWALFVPLAIGFSLLRDLFPRGVWFHWHKICIGIAITLTIIAFILALVNGNSTLSSGGHPTLGVILFTLCLVQVMSGFVRPIDPPTSQKPDGRKMSMTKKTTLSVIDEYPGFSGDMASVDLKTDSVFPPEKITKNTTLSPITTSIEQDTPIPQTLTDVDVLDTQEQETAAQQQQRTASPKEKEDAKPLNAKPKIYLAWELQHRIFGFGILGLAWATSNQGLILLDEMYDTGNGLGIFFWTSSATILGAALFIKIYQALTKHP